MKFKLLMMIGVTLLDVAFCTAVLRGAPPQAFETVKRDYRAGFAGDDAALERAIKASEETLAKDPKAAEPMVWHGAALMYKCGKLFQTGDYQAGTKLFDQGLKEMNDAVALEPGNPAVLIPRGATLIQATLFMPEGDESQALLRVGLSDYLKSLDVLKPHLDSLNDRLRGKLLFGVADAYYRLGDQQNAAVYFQRASTEAKGTEYGKRGEAWLQKKSLTRDEEICAGCDAR